MPNLTDTSRELFKRQPDECFPSLTALWEHCQRQKEACVDRWVAPRSIRINPHDDGAFEMNDWSFGLPTGNCHKGLRELAGPLGCR